MRKRIFYTLLFVLLNALLLAGCSSSMLGKQLKKSVNEQLYIDARLHFAIKHPLDWKRLKIPVSSPQYREDTIRWQVKDSQLDRGTGEMLIRSNPSDPSLSVAELLSIYLASQPDLERGDVEELTLPVGSALKLTGHDEKQGRLTIALKGEARDFIISLDSPSARFEELLPIFQDIVSSFAEVVKPIEQKSSE